jgi:AraC family transcriptional regulator, regulatory protein of adaptative response / DNA-3-methyladenine glycosylase II
MLLDIEACHQALQSHDPRFDGVFFVGISSTGIYCRPVCPARQTKRENRAFYASAAAAEKAGFRPCLRCRPELAPGRARIDAVSRLAAAIAGRIEEGALGEMNLEELAREFSITDRHLRRVVQQEFGVSPVELAQTQRLLTAKRLLTDTRLSVTEIAFASGFSSLRRFNALFRERYRLNPTALRKSNGNAAWSDTLRCELAYRPPLDWPALVAFLAARSTTGVETSDGLRYARTVRIGERKGWISARPSKEKNTLVVEISSSLAPAILPVLRRVRRLFDLDADPVLIAERLAGVGVENPGIRVPGAFDGFEMAVRAILGQQITVKAATTLAGRMVAAFGESIETPIPGLTHLPPTANTLAMVDPGDVAALGMPLKRAESLVAIAGAIESGFLCLEPGADVEKTMEALKSLPGIGEWTAQYVAMRALSWPDAFPHTDLGIMQALTENNPRRVLERGEAWRPWRAYAVMRLWKSLEEKQK